MIYLLKIASSMIEMWKRARYLYADLEERRALMRQPNVSKSYFGNTPENKSNVWNVPIARYRW